MGMGKYEGSNQIEWVDFLFLNASKVLCDTPSSSSSSSSFSSSSKDDAIWAFFDLMLFFLFLGGFYVFLFCI